MGRARRARPTSLAQTRSGRPSHSAFPFTSTSVAFGLVVVALVAVPALFNPRGQEAFDVLKAALLGVVGPLAVVCLVMAAWFERQRLTYSPLLLASLAVAIVSVLATALGLSPAFSFLGRAFATKAHSSASLLSASGSRSACSTRPPSI